MSQSLNDDSLPAPGDPSAAMASLPAAKRAALESLLGGKTISETARNAGVTRATIHNWLGKDPYFQAAYNQWHDEMERSCRSRLLMLTDKAADAVAQALESGDAKTALQLLKGMGLISVAPPRLTDPEELRRQAELDEKRRQITRECEERKLETEIEATEVEHRLWAKEARG
jgi:predicted transcriptional regulator